MPDSLKRIQKTAREMIRADSSRDQMFRNIDSMYRSEWQLPQALRELDWVKEVISTDPHDAVRAGTRVLSVLDPGINLMPRGVSLEDKELANTIERACRVFFDQASRRRRASIRRDIVMSALRYDEIAAEVMFIPWQIRAIKDNQMPGDTKRLERSMRQFGPFVIIPRNPQNVHANYSELGLENVLYAAVVKAKQFNSLWGNDKLAKQIKDEEAKFVTVYDYWSLDERALWVIPSQNNGAAPPLSDEVIPIVPPTEHDLPFIPWACRVGGTTLEEESEHQRNPLLYSIYQADQYDVLNTVLSLMASEVIVRAGKARERVTGPGRYDVETDYGDPGGKQYVPTGTDVEDTAPPDIDRALVDISNMFQGAIHKSTVSRILMGGDFPSGTAFATLNLATQTALGVLKPHKELSELAIEDVLALKLLWVEHSGESVTAIDDGRGLSGERKRAAIGRPLEIRPSDIDPASINFRVELQPDVPTDKQQRANTAGILINNLDYSKEQALEDVGVTDPRGMIEDRMREELIENEFQLTVEERRALAQMAIQSIIQQQVAQQQQAQQPQQQAQPGGIPGVGGPGFNPAEGGQPAQQAAPGATREGQTERTRTGEEIA